MVGWLTDWVGWWVIDWLMIECLSATLALRQCSRQPWPTQISMIRMQAWAEYDQCVGYMYSLLGFDPRTPQIWHPHIVPVVPMRNTRYHWSTQVSSTMFYTIFHFVKELENNQGDICQHRKELRNHTICLCQRLWFRYERLAGARVGVFKPQQIW